MNDAAGAAVSNCGSEEGSEHNTAATPETTVHRRPDERSCILGRTYQIGLDV